MKSIAIIAYYPGPLRVHPSLRQAIYLLSEEFNVDIYKCYHELDKEIVNKNVRIIHFGRYKSNPIYRIKSFLDCLIAVNNYHKTTQYIALIGIDAYGLLLAGIMKIFFGMPLVYYSLEILSPNTGHLSTTNNRLLRKVFYRLHNSILKFVERFFHKLVYFTIIQDELRWNVLKRLNKVTRNVETIFVPNSRIVKTKNTSRSRFLYDILNIPDWQVIVLYSGSVFMGSGIHYVVKECDNWPTCLALVLHVRGNPKIIDMLCKYGNQKMNVYVLNKSYNEKEYYEMLKSASIGLVWYDDFVDPNYFYIGAASGKLFYYLECCLPVVARRLPGLEEILEREKAGICVEHVRDIGPALRLILENYSEYSKNAFLCHEKYDFRKHFTPIVEKLKSIKL